MKVHDALVRAARTSAFVFVGLLSLDATPMFNSVDDIKGAGIHFVFAGAAALWVGVLNFVNNVAEDNTSYSLPK